MTADSEFKFTFDGDKTFTAYVDGVERATLVLASAYTSVDSLYMYLGGYNHNAIAITAGLSDLIINTESWDFSEQSGTTATGSVGSVFNLTDDTQWSVIS